MKDSVPEAEDDDRPCFEKNLVAKTTNPKTKDTGSRGLHLCGEES